MSYLLHHVQVYVPIYRNSWIIRASLCSRQQPCNVTHRDNVLHNNYDLCHVMLVFTRGGSKRGSLGGGGTHTGGGGGTVILGLFVKPIVDRSRGARAP